MAAIALLTGAPARIWSMVRRHEDGPGVGLGEGGDRNLMITIQSKQ